ncbi:MAG: lipoate--protein ligase family protein [Planctomycetes bacterium]|nr:lipoate--protein ligase family protein [Planctomycetota bacterium]
MSEIWRYINSGPVAPARAMALDEALLLTGAAPALRLYRWNPHAVSLGYFQKLSAAEFGRIAKVNIPIVRRLTGGGAIFHGDEVTFSITAPAAHPLFAGDVRQSYDRIHAAIARAVSRCCPAGTRIAARGDGSLSSDIESSPWCFYESTTFDLAAAGRKLVGSAQRRTGGRVLHHGSIILKTNMHTPETASIESLGGDPRPETVEDAMTDAFAEIFNIQFERCDPTPEENEQTIRLARDKYSADSWTGRI